MADDTRLPLGTQDGDTYRSDDNAGVKTQVVKLELGADGSFDGFVSAANPLPVTGTVAVGGAVDTELPAAAALADGAANPTTPTVGAASLVFNGTTWDRAPGDVANGLDVDVTRVSGNVTVVQGSQGSLIATVIGSAATDAPLGSFPVATGGRASAAAPADVSADGDSVYSWHLRNGAQAIQITAAGALIPGDAANGLDVDVTRLPALPAGTNNIGDVDILSVIPGTSATSLGKAEDDVAASGDVGVAILAVRRDAASSGVSADGDYANLSVDSTGALRVTSAGGGGGTSTTDDTAFTPGSTGVTPAGGFHLVARDTVNDGDTGAFAMTANRAIYSTIETPNGDSAMDETNDAVRVTIVAGAGSGGTSMTDDAAFTVGTSGVTPAAGTYRSVRDLVDDGDAGAFAMTQRRALLVQLESSGGTEQGTAAAPVHTRLVDGDGDSCMDNTLAALRVTIADSVALQLAAGAAEIGSVRLTDGTDTAQIDSAGNVAANVVGRDAHDAAVTGNPVLVAGLASAAAPTDVSADGDAVRAWHLRNGAQATVLTAAGALIGGDATNGLDVDVTRLPALPAGTNNIGDVDVLSLPALPAGTNNIGDVDVLTLPGVTGAAAHDAAVSGNPLLNGFEARTSNGTAVANGDAVRGMADTLGKQVTLVGAPHELDVQGDAVFTNTTAADLIAAQGAGIKIVITNILVVNAHATVGTKVEIRDGTTVLQQGFAAPLGGGWSMSNPRGILKSSANAAITGRCVTTGADVDIFVTGYTITNG